MEYPCENCGLVEAMENGAYCEPCNTEENIQLAVERIRATLKISHLTKEQVFDRL
jgi:hypothetical protein